ncbi:MAG: methylated-DNA--[protein]-cysteine S-methyltransferase, partial [Nitrospinales bacterium]
LEIEVTDAVGREFDLYFQGRLKKFTCPLDLRRGTPFQRKVWRALLTIPHGKTRSYRWVAQSIRNPKAVRAVGNANGKNPVSIIVPCHRVVQTNGQLGGYTGGVQIKRKLLDLESGQDGAI